MGEPSNFSVTTAIPSSSKTNYERNPCRYTRAQSYHGWRWNHTAPIYSYTSHSVSTAPTSSTTSSQSPPTPPAHVRTNSRMGFRFFCTIDKPTVKGNSRCSSIHCRGSCTGCLNSIYYYFYYNYHCTCSSCRYNCTGGYVSDNQLLLLHLSQLYRLLQQRTVRTTTSTNHHDKFT